MNNLPRTIKYVSVAAGVILIAACATVMQSQHPGINFWQPANASAERGVEISPEANLSPTQVGALIGVLQHYPKSIYKIQLYQNGTAHRTIGSLSALANPKDKRDMDAKVEQVATTAKTMAFTGSAICAGFCVGNSSTNKTLDVKAEELVRQLKPILEPSQGR